jgi:tRNA (guanine26-N2/guanine27-N2)-dimethyltransferase
MSDNNNNSNNNKKRTASAVAASSTTKKNPPRDKKQAGVALPPTKEVTFEGNTYQSLRENSATQLFLDADAVFYNPVQETNRDLSVAIIKRYIALRRAEHAEEAGNAAQLPPLRVLEALSATGLRSVRYAKEIPGLGEIVANDLEAAAVEAIQRNVRFNGVPTAKPERGAPSSAYVSTSHADAIDLLNRCRTPDAQFDIVDLDPYGSVSPFMNGAMGAVKDGGIVLITCTDMAVLGGNQQDVCYTKYGAAPVKGVHVHEQALRIVLAFASRVAALYKRTVEPLISLSIDFYVRIVVRVRDAPNESRRLLALHSMLYQCVSCDSFALQALGTERESSRPNVVVKPARGPPVGPECEHCGSRHTVGGPIWNGPLHNQQFASGVYDEISSNPTRYGAYKKAQALAGLAMSEIDAPLVLSLPSMCGTLKVNSMKDAQFHSALLAQGHQVSLTHLAPTLVKTNAPMSAVWDVMRSWAAIRPPKPHPEGSPAAVILSRAPANVADFSVRQAALDLRLNRPTLVHNPEYWGPKRRAHGGKQAAAASASTTSAHEAKKSRTGSD